MKKLAFIVVLTLFFGCTRTSTPDPDEQIVALHGKALESKDMEALEALLADDFIGYGPAEKGFVNKKGEVANWKRLGQKYDNYKFLRVSSNTVSDLDEHHRGKWVFVWGTFTYADKSGRPYYYSYHSSYKIENGKIKIRASNLNTSDIVSQVGYQFVPPPPRTALPY